MMLYRMSDLRGLHIQARDGELGKVEDLFYEDTSWTVRYFVVDTGGWLTGRLVLVSPIALESVDMEQKRLNVSLTRDQVERSPDIATDEPVSRQQERRYFEHYGWPYYWSGGGLWGSGIFPSMLASQAAAAAVETQPPDASGEADPHLRSAREASGYQIHAQDGEIGHVADFLVDPDSWSVRYVEVDTGGWLPGKKVLLAREWIERVSWEEFTVYVNVPRQAIEDAPEYDPHKPLDREAEQALYQHYGKQGYWAREESASDLSRS